MLVFTASTPAKLISQLRRHAGGKDHPLFLLQALYILILWNSMRESLMTLLSTSLLISIRVNPWKASAHAQLNAKVKELVNLSNLCNFQLFTSNNSGKSSHRKLKNCWGKKTLMGPYIVYKVLSFYNFSETIRYIAFKFLQITEIVMLFWYWSFDSLIREWKA